MSFAESADYQFPLRMTGAMREAIKEAASENLRSMNSEIVFRLARSFDLESANDNTKK